MNPQRTLAAHETAQEQSDFGRHNPIFYESMIYGMVYVLLYEFPICV